MKIHHLLSKAIEGDLLSIEEGIFLLQEAPLSHISQAAYQARKRRAPHEEVTWMIDRNVNTTNVCIANCKFCNFYRTPGHPEAYITDIDTYKIKIDEMVRYGGEQLLLQGGHHPKLGLAFYTDIFRKIKAYRPTIKLHALGPPEIVHIAMLEGISYKEVLSELIRAGLDSLPGAGAEILVDRVRRLVSNGKCNSDEWLAVMHDAHQLRLTTSATMMFGHVETIEERFEHLEKIRRLQNQKPKNSKGFISFIPWTFQGVDTLLSKIKNVHTSDAHEEYIRMIAISRLFLNNIDNIQASWLTVGKSIAQLCLHAGANDFGSIMIEENVVSAAGAPHRFTSSSIQEAIQEAGFKSHLRNQQYELIHLPAQMEEQVITY